MKQGKNIKIILACFVSILTFLIYLAALKNDFVNWDDGGYVYENSHIRSLGPGFFKWAFLGFYESNWHPLTWLSHALDYAAWGLDPRGHHLTSIIVHALNSFLVVVLSLRLTNYYRRKMPEGEPSFLNERTALIAAAVTGLLFGLHPVHVESVVWIAERKDVLCGLFFLLSLIAYLNFAGKIRNEEHWSRAFHDRNYLAALGLFILALLSKPMAVTLPVVLLILDWFPFNRVWSVKTFKKVCLEKGPFFALSLISSIITFLAQKEGGAIRSAEFSPLSARLIVAVQSLAQYLGKMIWPLDLIPYYPYPYNPSLLSLEYFLPFSLVIAVTIYCLFTFNKRKLIPATWGYYVITLIPVLGIVQVGGQEMADRYTYLPSIGPFLIVGFLAAAGTAKARSVSAGSVRIGVQAVVGVLMICALSLATLKQIRIWENSLVLWSYAIEKNPERAYLAYINRGLAFEALERADDALADYNKAIVVNPASYEAYINRGVLRGKNGMFEAAIEDFNRSLFLNPESAQAYSNRGIVLALAGEYGKALEDFNAAVALDPRFAEAYFNRARIYSGTGQTDLARLNYQQSCGLGYEEGCNALR